MHVFTWILGLLAFASLASVVAKRPWTTSIAKRHNPPEVWSTDLFHETNMVISGGRSLLFASAAVLAAVAPLWLNLAYGGILTVLGYLSPKFGARYSSRRLRAMGLSDSKVGD
jgi:hypothetical protein